MKKTFTLFLSLAITAGTFAQQVPNGGFETWTSPLNPDNWSTLASAIGSSALGALTTKETGTGNYTEGSASIKMQTDTVRAGGQLLAAPGMVGLGSATASPQGISFKGIPYTKRVDTIYFSVKYTPARPVDSAAVEFNLFNAGTSLFGGVLGLSIGSTNGSWRNLALPLYKNATTYYTNTTTLPDTLYMAFYGSTDTALSSRGSTLWLDNVRFDAGVNLPSSIEEFNSSNNGLNVYPNPAREVIHIAVEEAELGATFMLFDVQGREVYRTLVTQTRFDVATDQLPSGTYSIRMNSTDSRTTYKGRIAVAH